MRFSVVGWRWLLSKRIASEWPGMAEHFKECGGGRLRGSARDCPEFPDEALPVNGAELVQRYLATFALEAHRYSCGVGARNGGHGSNNDGLQMPVHFKRQKGGAKAVNCPQDLPIKVRGRPIVPGLRP